jgi:hypothetical protein
MAKAPDLSPPSERWGLWIEEVARALASNLTVKENLAQCWLSLTVVQGTTPGIQPLPLLRGRPAYGLSVERVELVLGTLTGPVWLHWEPTFLNGKPALKVLNVYGLATGAKASLTLLVKAE